MTWIDNAWVVGIGTGILSGILVTFVAQWFLSRKENRDYVKNVTEANREVVYSIRSGIPDEQIPAQEIIMALIHSTARRYGVAARDLYGPHEISEELIKEVMDSSFLPSAKKTEYGQLLLPIAAAPTTDQQRTVLVEQDGARVSREEVATSTSAVLGVIAAIGAALISLVAQLPREQVEHFFSLLATNRFVIIFVISAGAILAGAVIKVVKLAGDAFVEVSQHRIKKLVKRR